MKIDFSRSGKSVECKVTIMVPGYGKEVTWTFTHEHSDEFYASFVSSAMADHMRDAIEKMRRDSYCAGWKDAKAKKSGKQTWFRRFWDTTG